MSTSGNSNTSLKWAGLALLVSFGATAAGTAQAQDFAQGYRDDGYRDDDYRDDADYGAGNRSDDDRSLDDGEDAPDVSFFHDELADDGRWINHREHGYVWTPSRVERDWRPYTRGHWVHTDDYGWYWVSDERWGWATYHYGRWVLDDRDGWLWVPGTRWGPAWVAWRQSDEQIGWAPLPPDAVWRDGRGIDYDEERFSRPSFAAYWSFVEPRYIATPNVYRYCAPRERVTTIVYRTRTVTRYQTRGSSIVNFGISVNFFDRHLGRPITNVRVFASESRYTRGPDRRAGDVIRVWRPNFSRHVHYHTHINRGAAPRRWQPGQWRDVDRRPDSRRPNRTWSRDADRGPDRDRIRDGDQNGRGRDRDRGDTATGGGGEPTGPRRNGDRPRDRADRSPAAAPTPPVITTPYTLPNAGPNAGRPPLTYGRQPQPPVVAPPTAELPPEERPRGRNRPGWTAPGAADGNPPATDADRPRRNRRDRANEAPPAAAETPPPADAAPPRERPRRDADRPNRRRDRPVEAGDGADGATADTPPTERRQRGRRGPPADAPVEGSATPPADAAPRGERRRGRPADAEPPAAGDRGAARPGGQGRNRWRDASAEGGERPARNR
ncbi:MAG: DUF6600 domain-containing protein [Hyphomicrobium sp.]